MTQSASIHLTEPTINGDTGVWPTSLNNNMILIDRAVNGTVTVSVPDTNVTLVADGSTSDQSIYQTYSFTGGLTANRTITLPANYKVGHAINGTTGGFNIILSAGGTTLAVVPGSARVRFEVDGSNNITSPAVAAGDFLKAANGYTTDAGGVIRQWGQATTTGGTGATVTFPLAFPTACRSVVGTAVTTGNLVCVVNTIGTTSFVLTLIQGNTNVVTDGTASWMAVGY